MSEYRPFRGRARGRGGFQQGNNFRASMPNNFSDMRMPNPNFSTGPHFRNDNKNPRWQRPPHTSLPWRPARFKSNFSLNRPQYVNTVVKNPPNIKPSVPLPGSEEARQKNIAEASARIKEQLELAESNGGFDAPLKTIPGDLDDLGDCIIISSSPIDDSSPRPKTPDKKKKAKKPTSNPSHQIPSCSSVEELNKKILTQFTFMSKGKIQNLVNNPGSTKYDVALQHLIRDMKLNLSCELRTMYNNRETENSNENTMIDHFNSLVPDLGVELVSLPDTMVAELSKMLQLDENNELQAIATDAVENILVEPEDMFKQAQELLTNSQFLDDALQKSPDNPISQPTDPFDRRSPIFNCPAPNYNLKPPNLSLNLNNISDLDSFSPSIPSPTESQLNALVTPRLESMTQQIEQIEKDLDIPVPESANEISDTLNANLPNLFCQQSPLFRAADPSPFSKKLLEEFEEIAIRPVSSEPFTHLLNPILPSPPKSSDETNTVDTRSNIAPELKKPNNGAQLFDFDSVWITKQPSASTNNKQPIFSPEVAPKIDPNTQLNVTSFLQDVTYNEILNFDDCTTSSGKNRRSTSRTSSHSPFGDSSRNSNSSFPEDATSPAKRIPLDERIKQMMKMQDKGERRGKDEKEKIKIMSSTKLKKKFKNKKQKQKQKKESVVKEQPQEEAIRRVLLTEKPLNILKRKSAPEPVKGPLVFKKFGDKNNVKTGFITKKPAVVPQVVIKTEVIDLDYESPTVKSAATLVPKSSNSPKEVNEATKPQPINAVTKKSPKKLSNVPIKSDEKSDEIVTCKKSQESPVGTTQNVLATTVTEREAQPETSLQKTDTIVPQEEKSNWSDDNLDNVEPFSAASIEESDLCPTINSIPEEVQEKLIENNAKDENEKEVIGIENTEQIVEDKVEKVITAAQEVLVEKDVIIKSPDKTEFIKETCDESVAKMHDEVAKNIAEIFDDKLDPEKISNKTETEQRKDSKKAEVLDCSKPDTNEKVDLLNKNWASHQETSLEKVDTSPKVDKSKIEETTLKSKKKTEKSVEEKIEKPVEDKIEKSVEPRSKSQESIESRSESQEKSEKSVESRKSHESRASQEKIEKPVIIKSHNHKSDESRDKSQESVKSASDKKGKSVDKKHHEKSESSSKSKSHESRGKSSDNKKEKSSSHNSKSRSSTHHYKHHSSSKSTSHSSKSETHSVTKESWVAKPNQEILNRLFQIDMQINKLMQEKWDLYQVLNANKINNISSVPTEILVSETSIKPVSAPLSETSVLSDRNKPSNTDASTNTATINKAVDCAVNTDEPPPPMTLKRKAIHTQTYSDIEPTISKKRRLEKVEPLMVNQETNTYVLSANNSEKSVQYSSESDFSKFTPGKSHTPTKKPTSSKKSPKTKKHEVQYSSDSEDEDTILRLIRRKRATRKDTHYLIYSQSDSESAFSIGIPMHNKPCVTDSVETPVHNNHHVSDSEQDMSLLRKLPDVKQVVETKKNKKIPPKSNNKSIEETIDRVIENAERAYNEKKQNQHQTNNSLALLDEELREVTQKQITLPKKAVLETVGQNKELSEIDDNSDTEYYLRGFESQSNNPAKEEITVLPPPAIIINHVVKEKQKMPNKKKKKPKKLKNKSKINSKKETETVGNKSDGEIDSKKTELNVEGEFKVQKKVRMTRSVNKLESDESEITINRLRNRNPEVVINKIVFKKTVVEDIPIINAAESQENDNTQIINNENINQTDNNSEKASNVNDIRILNVYTLAQTDNSGSDFESVLKSPQIDQVAEKETEENNSVEQNAKPEEKQIEQSDNLESRVEDPPTQDDVITQESTEDVVNLQETEVTTNIDFIESNEPAQQLEYVVESVDKELESERPDNNPIIKKRVTKAEVKLIPINILEEENLKPQEASESDSNKNTKKMFTKAEVKQIPNNESEEQEKSIENIKKIPTKGEVKKMPVKEIEEESAEIKESLESIARNKRKRLARNETIQIEKEIDHLEELNNRTSRKISNLKGDNENKIDSRESSVEGNNSRSNRKRINKSESRESSVETKNNRKTINKSESRESSVETKNNRKKFNKSETLKASPRENQEELRKAELSSIGTNTKNMRKRYNKGDELLGMETINKNTRKKSTKGEVKKPTEIGDSDLELNRRKMRSKSETRKLTKETPEQEKVLKLHHEEIKSDLELNTRKRKRITKSESRKLFPKEVANESDSDDSNVKHLRNRITKSETRKLEKPDTESSFKNDSHVSNINSDIDSNDSKSISIRLKKREEDRNPRKRVMKNERRKSAPREASEEKETTKIDSDSESTPKVTRKRLKKGDAIIKSSTKISILESMFNEMESPKSVHSKTKKIAAPSRNRLLRSSISSLGSNESINTATEKQQELIKPPQNVDKEMPEAKEEDYCSDSSSKSKIRGNKKPSIENKIKNSMSPCFVRLRRITPERLSSFHKISQIMQVLENKPESVAMIKSTETIGDEVEKNFEAMENEKPLESTNIITIEPHKKIGPIELTKSVESTTENVEPLKKPVQPIQKKINDKVEELVVPEEAVEPEKMEVDDTSSKEVVDNASFKGEGNNASSKEEVDNASSKGEVVNASSKAKVDNDSSKGEIDNASSKGGDNVSVRGEEDNASSKGEDNTSSKGEDNASSKAEDNASSKGEDTTSSKGEDNTSFKGEDNTSSKGEDNTSSKGEDNTSSKGEDNASPKREDASPNLVEKEKMDSSFEPGKNQDHNVTEEIVSHQTTLQKNEERVEKESIKSKNDEGKVDDVLTNYVDPDSIYCKGHMKSILDIKIIGDEFLAASEDGTIYKYCCKTGALQDAYTGHKRAVTCLFVMKGDIINIDSNVMYTGSLDCTLKCYNIDTAEILHNVTVSQAIQCLDSAWGYIFLGTYEGLLFIYNIKKKYLNPQSLTIASSTVLMIKATQEGSRHILIVASRKREIMVRDAFTGLLLRTMCSEQSPTIYSLYLDRGSVYCGTSDKGIIIVEFNTGAQTGVYNSGKGVVCMVKYKQLLFAGCYDGFIYIYNTKMQKHVATIAGPGEGMVLSLVIHKGMIIAGNKKDHLLKIWKIPPSLLIEEAD